MSAFLRSGVRNSAQSTFEHTSPSFAKRRRARARAILSAAAMLGATSSVVLGVERTWDGGGANNILTNPANWVGDVAPVAGDVLVFNGVNRLAPIQNFPIDTSFGGITFTSTAGAFNLIGSRITLNGDIIDNTGIITQTIGLDLLLNATRNVNVTGSGFLDLTGVISGSGFGLTKTGSGVLRLSGSNAFTGPTTINGGVLSISTTANLGPAPGVLTPGLLIVDGGILRNTADLSISSNRGISVGNGGGSSSGTFETVTGTTLSYGGAITNNGGTGGLNKLGFGTMVLSGANTYTGPTKVLNGTVVLDFTQADSPVNNVISSSSALSLGGANAGLGAANFSSLRITGKDTTTNSQTFNGTHFDVSSNNIRVTSGAGGTMNVNLGALTRSRGSTAQFLLPTSGNVTTSTANVNGILGGWATVGVGTTDSDAPAILHPTSFAANDGSGNIVEYTGYTNITTTIANDPTANVRLDNTTSNVTLAASGVTDINTLSTGTATARNIVIGDGNTLRLGASGAIFRTDSITGGITWGIGNTGTSGTQNVGKLTAGGADNTPGEIIFMLNSNSETSGSLNVEVEITDNGTGSVSVIKTGMSSMKLRGHNSYSGGTYVLEGRLQLAGSENGGTGNQSDGFGTGPVYVMPGGMVFLSGTGGTVSNPLFLAGLGTDQEEFGSIRMGGGVVIAGLVTLTGDSRVSGGAATFSGQITGNYNMDFGQVTGTNVNTTVTLSNPLNDWTGTTTLNSRNGTNAQLVSLGASEVIPHGPGKGNVVMNGNASSGLITLNLGGFNETINGLSTTGNAGNARIRNNLAASGSTLTIGDFDQGGSFGGVIEDGSGTVSLTKIGAGVQILSGNNTYTGPTNINNGVLSVTGSLSNTGTVFINTGSSAGRLSGTGPVGHVVMAANVGNDRATINPGATGQGDVGTLTLSSLTVNGGVLAFDLFDAGTNQDFIQVNGAANFTGASVIAPGPTGNVGTYTVLSASSLSLGVTPTLVQPTDTRNTFSLFTTANQLQIQVTGGAKSLRWTGSTNSAWDIVGAFNWLDLNPPGAAERFFNGDAVTFDDNAAAANRSVVIPVATSVNPGTIIINHAAGSTDYVFSGQGNIATTSQLIKNGTGAAIIAVANASTGSVTINAGTLQIGNGGTLGGLGTGTVTNNSVLVFDRSDAFTQNNNITGSGTLRKQGSGTLTLGGQSDYSGTTQISQGTLRAGTFSALGNSAGTVTVSSGGALDIGGLSAADAPGGFFAKPFSIAGSGVGATGALVNTGPSQIEAFQQLTLTADATIGGTGRFDLRNGGATLNLANNTLTKTGTNTFNVADGFISDGNIVVDGGVFSIEGSTSVQDFGSGKTMTFNPGSTAQFLAAGGTITRPITLNGASITNGGVNTNSSTVASNITLTGTSTFTANNNGGNQALILTGSIGQDATPRGMIKTGAGTLDLQGNNTFTGGVTINAGTLQVSNAGALNSTTPNAVAFGPGASSSTALRLNGNSITIGGLTTDANPGSPIVENAGGADATLTVNNSTIDTFAGSIQNNGPQLSLTKAGSGALILSGSSNYSGVTTISGGTLQVGAGGATGEIGTSEVVNTANLAFARSDAFTFSNLISGTGGNVHQAGPGTTVLTAANTYSGTTNVNGGALVVNGSLLSSGSVSVNASGSAAGRLGGAGSVGHVTMAANSGSNIASIVPGSTTADGNAGTLSMSSLIVNGGNFRLDTGGTNDRVQVSGVASFTAGSSSTITPVFQNVPTPGVYTLINASSVQVNGTASLSLTEPVTNNGTITNTRISMSLNTTATQVQLNVAGAPKSLFWRGTPGGTTWDLADGVTGNVNWVDGSAVAERFFNLDSVTFDDTALDANRSVTLNSTVKPTAVTVNHSSGADYSITGTGNITGITSLVKSGSGTLVLGAANTYTGGTNVQNGTLRLATSTALPAGGSLNLGDGGNGVLDLAGFNASVGTLSANGASSVVGNSSSALSTLSHAAGTSSFSGTIQDTLGAGTNKVALAVDGGHLTLTGPNTYTGLTTVNANATLRVGDGGSSGQLGGGSVNIAANGTLQFERGDTITVANVIDGAGTLNKAGGGTLILTGANTLSGTTLISGGALQVGGGTTTGSLGAGPVIANANLVFNRSDALTVTSAISGGAEIRQAGTGTTILAAANTYTGTTVVASGAIRATVSGSLGAIPGGEVQVLSGGAIDVGGGAAANGINFGQKQFVIAGDGVSGSGALTNSGTLAQQNSFQRVRLAANASVGGTGRLDIRAAQVGGANVAQLDLQNNTLTKAGNMQFTLVNADVTDGNIVVNQGTFAIEGTTNLTGNGSLNFAGNDTRLQFFNTSGTLTVTRPVFINGSGVAIGNNSATASFFSSPITLNNNVTFQQFGSSGGLNVLGNITETGGPRTLIRSLGSGASTVSLAGNNSFTGGVIINGGALSLANPGALNSTTPNTVTFGPSAAATAILHLNGNSITIAGLATDAVPGTPIVENNSATASVLTINGTGSFSYAGTIRDGAAAGGTLALVKNGTGTQSILGTNSYTGGTTVNQGALIATRYTNATGSLVINGGIARVSAKGAANDPTGTSVLTPANLTIAVGAQLDLTNNSMVLDYSGPVGSLINDTRLNLQSGRIASSNADATKGLGYADNAVLGLASFAGQTVDASSVLVKYTYFGDTNLDGQVDITDLGNLATAWQTNGTWIAGDSDYSGFIDITDLGALATNWQAGVGSPLGPSFNDALAAVGGLGGAAVPEPAALGMLGLGLVGMLARRSRR